MTICVEYMSLFKSTEAKNILCRYVCMMNEQKRVKLFSHTVDKHRAPI